MLRSNENSHTDHLNTPRLIANNVGQTVWQWDNTDPFANNAPNENPGGQGNFTCNLRLPGQYYDKETNLHYNYFRDYDPAIGRYIQSDPIGLAGGINTYSYVGGNPLSYADPTGLDVNICYYPEAAGGFGHVGFGFPGDKYTKGFGPTGSPISSPGYVGPDDNYTFKECKVIKSKPEQDDCMARCMKERESNPGTYAVRTRNCMQFVRDCLKECGLPGGSFVGNAPRRFFLGLPGVAK